MPKTFTNIYNACIIENSTLVHEICEPIYRQHFAGIDNALKFVNALERDGIRSPEEAVKLREAVRCVAENNPKPEDGLNIDYYTPTLFPLDVNSPLSQQCGLKAIKERR